LSQTTHKGHHDRPFKYYNFLMAAFVAVLLCSNLIGPGKVARLFDVSFGAGVLFFPISYVFGDVLTEVYGYARARRVVWTGFAALAFASLMSYVIVSLPADPGWHDQAALAAVFGQTPRIVAASLIAFFAGEMVNAFVLAKMKILTEGRYLWTRTIGSTLFGQAVDSIVFYPVAFFGYWSNDQLIHVMMANFALKVGWEAVLTPVTYQIVGWLKRVEHEDFYDTDTNFTPFSIET
jgi:uncharacterized integral membrane protein (TIGR00697 family)